MTGNDHRPAYSTLRSPWVLVEDGVVDHSAEVLERLTNWLLTGTDTAAITRCTRALSLGETWPASQISDTGPYRVRTGMEDGKCQNGAGSIRPSLRTRR